MTTIKLKVPENKQIEYKEILNSFVMNYSLDELRKINENKFYVTMLDSAIEDIDNGRVYDLDENNGKVNLSSLLK